MPGINAGAVVLKVTTPGFEPEQLQELLNHTAANPVEVTSDTITVDEADLAAVKAILMEVGLATETEEQTIEGGDPEVPAVPEADAVTEDEIYDEIEASIRAAGDYQGVLCGSGMDASWLMVAGDEAVARIRLKAQEGAAQLSGYFGQAEYFQNLQAAFDKHGIAATLKMCKAEAITAKSVTPSQAPDIEAIKASAVDHYRNCMSLAASAASKNLITNRLKAAAFDVLAEQGVEDPEAVIEAIFAASEEYLEDLDQAAGEYAEMDASAFTATSKLIASMGVQAATTGTSVAMGKSPEAVSMTAALTAGNMPLTSQIMASAQQPADEVRAAARNAITRRIGR